METPTERFMQRVAWWALAVLVLTGVHHAYGAAIYHTPWRLHVVFISALTAAAILGSLRAFRRRAADLSSRIAFWAFVAVVLAVPVAGIGAFEGGYNHALKNALYFSGASTTVMRRLFPPPAYELPDDVFFEFTGVLQLVLAVVTGRHLLRLVRERRRGQEVSTSEERIKQTVRRIFEDYVNRGESELLHVLFAEDYAGSQSGAPSTGRDGFAATMGALPRGSPTSGTRFSISSRKAIGSPLAGSGRERIAECFEGRPERFRPRASRSRTTGWACSNSRTARSSGRRSSATGSVFCRRSGRSQGRASSPT